MDITIIGSGTCVPSQRRTSPSVFIQAAGTTILLTTHYLEEAEELCDRIAIIDQGKLVVHEETQTLLRRLDSKVLSVIVDRDLTSAPPELAAFGPELKDRRRLTFRYKPSRIHVGAILASLNAAQLLVVDLTTEETDLEDIFLQLTS